MPTRQRSLGKFTCAIVLGTAAAAGALLGLQLVESKSGDAALASARVKPPRRDIPAAALQDRQIIRDNVHWESIRTGTAIPANVLDLSPALERLHATTLTAFESAPNFSYQRMPPVISQSSPPRHVPLLKVKLNTLIEEDRQPYPDEPKPTEAWLWLKQMTGLCAEGFVYRPNEIRWDQHVPDAIDRLACGYPDPNERTYDRFADKLADFPAHLALWKVSSLELIGLWQGSEPVVFEHRDRSFKESGPFGMSADGLTGGERLRLLRESLSTHVRKRDVDQLESNAVASLQKDVQIVATYDADEPGIRLVSAIRATEACLKCHDTEVGTLLGAFTYKLKQIPAPKVSPPIPAQVKAFPWIRKVEGSVRLDEQNRTIGVNLVVAKVTDTDLARLKNLAHLEWLSLWSSKIHGEGLVHLKRMTELRELGLAGNPLSDVGLPHLSHLQQLRELELHGTNVTDAGLAHLTPLKNLNDLSLGDTKITDAGLVHLKQLPSLGRLVLNDCNITDAGLVHLADLKNLHILYLEDTQVTAAGVKKLRAELPMCTIRH